VMIAAASMEGQVSPSAPGQPPAIDTGLLHDSLQSKMTGATSAMAYTNVEYAPHLEYGTVHMEPRPFMVPAAEQVRPSFEQAMREAMGRI
jgi:HK97 gp10 family phage protein